MHNTELTFQSGSHQLAGTLCTDGSDGGSPVALLISGSGPIDRDSNMKQMSTNVMRQVADHLETVGISSFRYDKRGVGASDGEFLTTGMYDNVVDARAAIGALRLQPELVGRPLFVVGHSEGSIIATELAAADPTLAGVVLLAGPATVGEHVLRWQAERVSETLSRAVKVLLRVLRQDVAKTQAKRFVQIRESSEDMIRMQFVKVNAKWMREFMAHDPSESLTQVAAPLLAITGSKDIQVDPDDVAKIVELAGGETTGHVLDDVTHLLRVDDGPATVRTYKKQVKRPVEPLILEAVSTWISEFATHVSVQSAP